MNIGAAIRKSRIRQGMTQQELCKRMGLTQSFMSQIESGKRETTTKQLKKVALILDTPLELIMFMSMDRDQVIPENRKFYDIVKPIMNDWIEQILESKTN